MYIRAHTLPIEYTVKKFVELKYKNIMETYSASKIINFL